MLLTGVLRTFTAKILIQLGFDSSYVLNFGMSLGMFACLGVLLPEIALKFLRKESIPVLLVTDPEGNPLIGSGSGDVTFRKFENQPAPVKAIDQCTSINFKTMIYIELSTLCDVTSSGLNFLALLWLPAAVNEVLRSGTEMITTALIMVVFRGQKVTPLGWISIVTLSIGLTLVSGGMFVHSSNSSSSSSSHQLDANAWIGMLISIPRAIVAAMQNYFDQQLVQTQKLAPTVVVGLEGFSGVIMMLLAWPVVQYSGITNINADVRQLFFSSDAALLLSVYIIFLFFVATSNYFSVSMVASVGALTKEIWRSLRPPILWVFSLMIYYSIQLYYDFTNKTPMTAPAIGERWDTTEASIRLVGIALVTAGIIGYSYQANQLKELEAAATAAIKSKAAELGVTGSAEGIDESECGVELTE